MPSSPADYNLPQLTTISLGWGVQSWGLLAMSALGVLPPVDFAIHGDTGWERSETYAFAKRWTPWVEEHGIKIVTVRASKKCRNVMFDSSNGQTMAPLFTFSLGENQKDPKDYYGKLGQLNQSCTQRWKIAPMRRWLSAELKRRGLKKSPDIIEQWIGFTLDEVQRVTPDDVQYATKSYPYLEMLDRPYTRQMVIHWLRENDLEIPVKSACVFCPFRRWQTWRQIQLSGNGDWQRAIKVDRAIRHKRPGYLCYVCDDRRPLEDHDFTRQMALW